MLLKISHAFTVDLYNLKRTRFLNEILGHDTHARSYLQHGKFRTSIHRIGYRLGNVQVSQKMLAEVLLRSYLFHLGAKIRFCEKKTKENKKKRQAGFISSPPSSMLSL